MWSKFKSSIKAEMMFASFRAWCKIKFDSKGLWSMALRRKILLRKREIHLLALIQSGIAKRVVDFVFTLRHPVLNGIFSYCSSTYFSGIVMQVYGFVKIVAEWLWVKYPLYISICSSFGVLNNILGVSSQEIHMWILEKICWYKNRIFSSFNNLVITAV